MRLDLLTLLRDVRATRLVRQHWTAQQGNLERVMGIEPTLVAWEATVLPLNYTRAPAQILCRFQRVGKSTAPTDR